MKRALNIAMNCATLMAIAMLLLPSGCSARKPVQSRPNPFWRGCEETMAAKSDDFQHFICTMNDGREVEVNLRLKGNR